MRRIRKLNSMKTIAMRKNPSLVTPKCIALKVIKTVVMKTDVISVTFANTREHL